MPGETRITSPAAALALALCLCAPATLAQEAPKPEAAQQENNPFRSRLDSSEYERRISRFDPSRLAVDKVLASKLPDFGVIVNDAAPDGPAAKAGLLKGWIIDRYKGEEYWNHHQGMRAQGDNNDDLREIEAVSPEGERKTFSFGPGKLGINTSNAHRPEQYVLRNTPVGAWSLELLVAVQAWHDNDHELLETALHRCVAHGMPANPIAHYYAAIVALDRGDKVQAKILLDKVLAHVGKDGVVPRFYRSGFRTLALGVGDYGLLRKAIAEQEGFQEELQAEMLEPWEAWAKTAAKESLVMRAKGKEGANLLPGIVTVKDGWEKFYRIDDAAVLRDGTHFAAKSPPDYDDYCFAPEKPVKNVLWEIHGGYGDIQAPGTFKEIAFYLVDLKRRKTAAERMSYWTPLWTVAGFRIRNDVKDGRTLYLSAGINEIEIPTKRSFSRLGEGTTAELVKQVREGKAEATAGRKGGFTVQLVRYGNEAEVVVDGVPCLRLPVDPSVGELGCVLHSSGMAVAIDAMNLVELEAE